MTTPTNPRMGTVLRTDGRIGVRYVRHLAHPREKVWRALTESEHLRHWFPCDIVGDRRAGAALELPFWPDHVEVYEIEQPVSRGRLHVWEPPRLFEWSWDTDLLRWELEEAGGVTVLTFTTWIGDPLAHGEPGRSPDDETGFASASAGYHVCLDHLETWLDGRMVTPLVEADTTELQTRYRQLL